MGRGWGGDGEGMGRDGEGWRGEGVFPEGFLWFTVKFPFLFFCPLAFLGLFFFQLSFSAFPVLALVPE